MRSGLGAYVGVAAAAALAGACLAGGPLYVSSAASEAVQVGLERTCLTDAGLVVRLARNPSGPEADLVEAAFARRTHRARARHGDRPPGPDQGRVVDPDPVGAPRSDRAVRRSGALAARCRGGVLAGLGAGDLGARPRRGGRRVDRERAALRQRGSTDPDAVDALLADDPRPVPGHPGQPRAVVLVRPPHAAAPDRTGRPSPANAHRGPGDVPRVAEAQPVTDRRGAPRPQGADAASRRKSSAPASTRSRRRTRTRRRVRRAVARSASRSVARGSATASPRSSLMPRR